MKKLVRVWFPVMRRLSKDIEVFRRWSEDIVVTIPDNIDSDEWLENERIRLIKENSEYDPSIVPILMAFSHENGLSTLLEFSFAGAKFVEPNRVDSSVKDKHEESAYVPNQPYWRED